MEGIKGIKFRLELLLLFPLYACSVTPSCLPLSSSGINVHLIPHSHDDVGWVKTVDEYYKVRVRRIYDTVIEALWANEKRRYKLSIPKPAF